jgi:hypothetical protein
MGNNRPTGHSASKLRPPALSRKNQRSRVACQRCSNPIDCSSAANAAPAAAPALFNAQSTRDGTRPGRNCCTTSVA